MKPLCVDRSRRSWRFHLDARPQPEVGAVSTRVRWGVPDRHRGGLVRSCRRHPRYTSSAASSSTAAQMVREQARIAPRSGGSDCGEIAG